MDTSLEGRKRGISDTILDTIGHTPLVRLPAAFDPEVKCEVLLKVESMNPGGSVKDRIALNMIRQAEASGKLAPGGVIVECTSGNTGAGLCMVASAMGYCSIMVIPDKMSQEKVDLLRAYGAKVVVVPSGVPPDHPQHYTNTAERIARETPGGWLADQFHNPDNPGAHEITTGPELWEQTGGRLDVFVAGCGTGGTITGTARYLKQQDPSIRVVGVDPPGSIYEPYWRTGKMTEAGCYAVEGVGEDQLPDTWDPALIDGYQVVEDHESFAYARRLAAEVGIFAGGSAGMALAAALREARPLPENARLVVLLPDSGDRYLSKVFQQDWMRDHGYLPQVSGAAAQVGDLLRERARAFVTPDDDLAQAHAQMADRGVRPLPVQQGLEGELLGVVDEEKLLALLCEGADLERVAVRAVLAPAPPVLDAEAPWQRAREALSAHPAVLVRDPEGLIPLDRHDLLRALPRLRH